MNKIYKVVFNKALGRFVVASECAKSATKSGKTVTKIGAALITTVMAATASANIDPHFEQGENNVQNALASVVTGLDNTSTDVSDVTVYGHDNRASVGGQAVISGVDNTADGFNQVAISGVDNVAYDVDTAVISGLSNHADANQRAVVFGDNNSSYDVENSLLLGSWNRANDGYKTTIVGDNNSSEYVNHGLIVGSNNMLYASEYGTAMTFGLGNYSDWVNNFSLISGLENSAFDVDNAVIYGGGNTIGSSNNFAILAKVGGNGGWRDKSITVLGLDNDVYGSSTVVTGHGNEIEATDSTVNGQFNAVYGQSNTIVGSGNTVFGNKPATGMATFALDGAASEYRLLAQENTWYNWNGDIEHYGYDPLYESYWADQSSNNVIVGNLNDIAGNSNKILGSENTSETIYFGEIDSDSFEEAKVLVDNAIVVGDYNTIANNSIVVGDYNRVKGYAVSIGHDNTVGVGGNLIGRSNALENTANVNVHGSGNSTIGESHYYINYGLDRGEQTDILSDMKDILSYYNDVYYGDYFPYWLNEQLADYTFVTAENSNIVGDKNRVGGSRLGVFGTSNVVSGYKNNTVGNGNISLSEHSSILGNNNDNMGAYNSIVGNENQLSGTDNSVVGHGNRGQNIYGSNVEIPTINDLADYYNYDPIGSNVLGSGNVFGDETNIVGNENSIYGYGNAAFGRYNTVLGESNFVLGRGNNVGEYISGGWYADIWYDSELNQGYNNNIVGSYNNIVAANTSILGDGNIAYHTPVLDEIEWDVVNTYAMPTDDAYSKRWYYEDLLSETERGSYYYLTAVVGYENTFGQLSGILGNYNSVVGVANAVTGNGNIIDADNTFVGGHLNQVIGEKLTVVGGNNSVYSDLPIDLGIEDGDYNYYKDGSTVIGYHNGNTGDNNAVVGNFNTVIASDSNVLGRQNQLGTAFYTPFEIDGETYYEPTGVLQPNNNNVVGNQNTVVTNFTTIVGDNNFSAYGQSLLDDESVLVELSPTTDINQYARQSSDRDWNDWNWEDDSWNQDYKSVVVGYDNIYSQQSGIFGSFNESYGFNNNIVGNANYINGEANFVGGIENTVDAYITTVVGGGNYMGGIFNTAVGYHNDVVGGWANAVFGAMNSVTDSGQGNLVTGNYNITNGYRNNIVGRDNISFSAVYSYDLIENLGAMYLRNWLNVDEIAYEFFGNDEDDRGYTENNDVFGAENLYLGYNHLIAGQRNWVKGYDHNVVGKSNQVSGSYGTVFGANNIVESGLKREAEKFKAAAFNLPDDLFVTDAIVVGNSNYANSGSIVLGSDSSAIDGGIALGHGAIAEYGNIALGHNVVAGGYTLDQDAYFVGGTAGRELAIGSSDAPTRITGVAAGSEETDAVNVQQLRAVYEELALDMGNVKYKGTVNADTNQVEYDKSIIELATTANTGSVNVGGTLISGSEETNDAVYQGGKTVETVTSGGTVIRNVARAQNADEAVNKGLLDEELALRDLGIEQNATNIATNTANIAQNTADIATHTAQIANINETGVFFGRDTNNNVDRSKLILGGDNNVLTQIKNVDRAVDGTDAINLEQAEEMIGALDFGGIVRYDRNETNDGYVDNQITLANATTVKTVNIGGTLISGSEETNDAVYDGGKDVSVVAEGGTVIRNVAKAQNADEAVNKGLLDESLAVRDLEIEQNAADILVNKGNIATNTTNIATNATNIATNTSNIATNTANIAQNTADIATHTTQINNINETGVFFGRDGENNVDRFKLILGGDNNMLTQIKNVARATAGTDAINLEQAQEMIGNLDFGGIVRYDRVGANYSTTSVTLANSVTLGTETYGENTVSVVTAGGTSISHVANAERADQAVNLGQMNAAFAKLNDEIGTIKGAIQYEILENGDVDFGVSVLKGDRVQTTSDNPYNVTVVESGGTKIKNLANAEFADEAVNLGQMELAIAEKTLGAVQYNINGGIVDYSTANLRGAQVNIVTDENNVSIVEDGGTIVANLANATRADHAVNLGVLQSTLKPVEINVEQNTNDINTINETGLFFASSLQGGSLSVDRSKLILGTVSQTGEVLELTQLKNIANAVSRTDAVNLGQVEDMFAALPNFDISGTVKYDVLGGVTNYNKVTLAGGEEGTIVSNVADAVEDKDAVNLGQMNAELSIRDERITTNSQNIAQNTADIATHTTQITNINETGVFFGRGEGGVVDKSVLTLAQGGTRITNVANAVNRNDAVNYGQVLDLLDNVPTEANLEGMVRYDRNEDGSFDKNSLTLEGSATQTGTDKNGVTIVTGGGTTISNVANAERADQAVNKGQMDSAIADLKAGSVQYDRDEDGNIINNKITLGGEGGTVITNVANGKIEIGSTDAVNGGQIAELINNIEIPEQLVTQDAETKEINVATHKDGKVVNVNGTEGDRIVAGVADGKISSTSNEAITGKQLNTTNHKVAEFLGGNAAWNELKQEFEAPTYQVSNKDYHDVGSAISALDARDNALENKVNDLEQSFTQQIDATRQYIRNVEKRLNAGVASAMAMEAAPFVAGKFTYAVGAAHHGGEQAVGATFRRTAESGRWSITTGIAKATEGEASVRIGISGVID